MSYPDPALEPPFLSGIVPAKDADFPVPITERAQAIVLASRQQPYLCGPGNPQ